ncbi:Cif family virulence factor [Flavobacterium suncheonense]|uniref:3-methyl-2-oxobutanoate hydroxymethyltransferase n=1 Tax=Flavobacterium suncheonense GH29-5 = DSM 17707 TaxID=1121899 RepID=A0A0A2MFW7_9FLAO|nr:nuclear transport factor 2 family protein [Flavobacterium suncheonense]KGO87165.1 3-methyl-2-oxobutanoate hydroxymethyltransferase [Flavobacterium suncheonense GH29-5 = DSM 17707]
MKKILLLIIFCFSTASFAQKAEVENTVKTFFEAFHAKDTLKIKSVCHENLILQSIMEGPKGTKFETEKTSEFYKSIATFPANMTFEEQILSYNIQIDGKMAHAWTPYEFYINGKLSHSGVNAFTFYKENDVWKIIHLIDTRGKK